MGLRIVPISGNVRPMKYFIFDIGKVLVDFDFADFSRICSGQLGRPMAPFSADELELRDAVESGHADDSEWLALLNEAKGLGWTMDDLVGIWSEMFSVNETGCGLFKKAQQADGVSVHTLSNIAWHHMEAIEKNWSGFFDGADGLFLSYQIGVRKPNAGIYRHALDQLGADPAQCFFIDDLPENVQAARVEGINAHQFIPENHAAIQQAAAEFFGWD